jgi:hypothetical protein
MCTFPFFLTVVDLMSNFLHVLWTFKRFLDGLIFFVVLDKGFTVLHTDIWTIQYILGCSDFNNLMTQDPVKEDGYQKYLLKKLPKKVNPEKIE